MMTFAWQPNRFLSALHCAWCLQSVPGQCSHIPEPVLEASQRLLAILQSSPHSLEEIWQVLLRSKFACKAEQGTPDFSLLNQSPLLSRWTKDPHFREAIHLLIASFDKAFPSFLRELELRSRPIKEHWEAIGPGLTRDIFERLQLSPNSTTAFSAQIHLLQPVLGGAGHLLERPAADQLAIALEAVLTNEDPSLPETLRIAWLLACQTFAFQLVDNQEPTAAPLSGGLQLLAIPAALETADSFNIPAPLGDPLTLAIQKWLPQIPKRLSEQELQSLVEEIQKCWATRSTASPWAPSNLTCDLEMIDNKYFARG